MYLVTILNPAANFKRLAILCQVKREIDVSDVIQAVGTCQFEYAAVAVAGALRQSRQAQAQIADFRTTNANEFVGKDLSVAVCTRGDVDNEACCHMYRESAFTIKRAPDQTAEISCAVMCSDALKESF